MWLGRTLTALPVIYEASRLHPTAVASPVRHRAGDYVVYSLGPAKPIDAGEGGLLILPDPTAHARALTLSAHLTRLAYQGLAPAPDAFPMRVSPLAAILSWEQLTDSEFGGRCYPKPRP